ncbi:MAG: hypothetical protein IVW57_02030 [Ktedonobacterales bacterium]|nr:hypothetical protein [Ktedonobacterales bacterium]
MPIAERGSARKAASVPSGAAFWPLAPLDLAFLGALALQVACSLLAAVLAAGWITAASTDLVVGGYLLALATRHRWRPLVGRLLLLGLVAGLLELATDAAGEGFAHSLVYPQGEPSLWASPFYMPLSWMIVLAQLGYLAWRLRSGAPRVPVVVAVAVTGLWSAFTIPFYEEMASYARWWRYTTAPRIGHTPLYVVLFEGLIGAAIPLLVWQLPERSRFSVVARGVVLSAWIPCAALLAWLALGRS